MLGWNVPMCLNQYKCMHTYWAIAMYGNYNNHIALTNFKLFFVSQGLIQGGG